MAPRYSQLDLTERNTMALSCVAERFVELATDDEVLAFFQGVRGDVLILGGGSNVILPERIRQPVVSLKHADINVEQETETSVVLRVGAAVVWDALVAWSVAQGYYGLENLSLIPGSVGAAPVQNIGAYGVELKERVLRVRAYDRQLQRFVELTRNECEFAYRDSVFKRHSGRYVITEVCFELSKQPRFVLTYGELQTLQDSPDLSLQLVRDTVIAVRSEKLPDPSVIPNTGSFFKNPVISKRAFDALQFDFPGVVGYPQGHNSVKVAAGWLIDQAGFKAKQLGAARVHDRQALVLTNTGGARQNDILDLAGLIQSQIKSIFSVELEIEPVVIQEQQQEPGHD